MGVFMSEFLYMTDAFDPTVIYKKEYSACCPSIQPRNSRQRDIATIEVFLVTFVLLVASSDYKRTATKDT